MLPMTTRKHCLVRFRQEEYLPRPCKFTMVTRINGEIQSVRCTNCGRKKP